MSYEGLKKELVDGAYKQVIFNSQSGGPLYQVETIDPLSPQEEAMLEGGRKALREAIEQREPTVEERYERAMGILGNRS